MLNAVPPVSRLTNPALAKATPRRAALVASTVIAMLAALIAPASGASAAPTASIAGVVMEAGTGLPIESAYVTVLSADGAAVSGSYTDAAGAYSIGGLEAGQYRAEFAVFGGPYLREYFADARSLQDATAIELVESEARGGVDAALEQGASISGVVRSAATGEPVSGANVGFGTNESYTEVVTELDGSFRAQGLSAGSYSLTARAPGFAQTRVASPVPVQGEDAVTGVDIELADESVITGRVTDSSTGSPIEQVSISAFDPAAGLSGWGVTDENGDYRIGELGAGSYEVSFDATGLGYAAQSWPGTVPLAVGETVSGVDAALELGGSVSGTVIAAGSGLPLANVSVSITVADQEYSSVAYAFTDESGAYQAQGIPAGSYKVRFSTFGTAYTDQWFNAAESFASATEVAVVGGQQLAGIDAVMTIGGSITGTLIDDTTGAPVEGASVYASRTGAGGGGSSTSGPDGRYAITGLAGGEYSVSVSGMQSGYVSLSTSRQVTVATGSETSGVDFALELGATIRGTVTDESGNPISQVQVCAESADFDVFQPSTCNQTADDGSYSLFGVPSGSQLVKFDSFSGPYAPEWWNGAATRDDATAIATARGSEINGIDASVSLGGVIEGIVLGSAATGDEPLEGVSVCVQSQLAYSRCTNTAADGTYSVQGFASGQYTVSFGQTTGPDGTTVYVGEFWNDAISFDSADLVSVTVGETTSDVSALLARAASVTGRVTTAGGNPAPGVQVRLAASGRFVPTDYLVATTAEDGSYELEGVRPGSYKALFIGADATPALSSEWWNGASSASAAAAINLDQGEQQGGIDVQLDATGAFAAPAPVVTQLAAEPGATWTSPTSAEPILAYEAGFSGGFFGDGGYMYSTLDPREFALDVFPSAVVSVRALTASGWGDYGHGIILGTDGSEALAGPTIAVSGVSATAATLSFSVPASTDPPIVEWLVEGKTARSSFAVLEQVVGDAANTASVTLDDLEPSTTYRFFVLGRSSDGSTRFAQATVTTAAAPLPPVTTATPTISGTAAVGRTLTAAAGAWTPAPVTFAYQWMRGNTPIAGATSATYTATAADLGASVSVRVTGSKSGYSSASADSSAVTIAAGTLVAPTPTVSGLPRVGSLLTAVPGTWQPAPVALTYQWLRNGSPIAQATGTTYTLVSADAGTTISVRVTGARSGYASSSVESAPTAPITTLAVSRLAGPDRYATAATIAAQFPAEIDVVYISTGRGFPDALGAAAAAAHLGGALLLVEPDSIPLVTQQQLTRLKPDLIVVVGGPTTVSTKVEQQLAAYAGPGGVRRDAGADRFETSRIIAERAFGDSGAASAYIATGMNFPDALTASAAAGAAGAPVILVYGPGTSADAPTKALIDSLGTSSVTIVGGLPSVSQSMEDSLEIVLGDANVTRRAGINRYETGLEVNKAAFASADVIHLATGANFPDALAGGALAGSAPGPLYVIPGTCVPANVLAEITRLGATKVVLFGSTPSLSNEVARLVPCA